MSSSMFIESSSLPGEAANYASTSDSNLVVVYGKNGISFDDKGLENLIEEKQISSISVIRLTSPTPSMEEEEEEEAKLEEMFRRQEIRSGENSVDEENSSASDSDKRVDDDANREDDSSDCREKDESEQSVEGSGDEATEEQRNIKLSRQRSLQTNVGKQKRSSRKRKRMRPEIVGLRLEEFYPPEDANEIIKEALKMAGLGPDRKNKEDFEFQLFVIRNDHCYTPFTSPSQMKAKLAADKLETEKQASSRKIIGVYQTAGGGKQLFVRKKMLQKQENQISKVASTSTFTKDKNSTVVANKINKDCRDAKPQVEVDCPDDDDTIRSSNDEGDNTKDGEEDEDSDGALTEEESDESDNDRDSDLDFDVNNPKGKRRKVKVPKFVKRHLVGASKVVQKTKRFYSQEEPVEITKKSPSMISANRQKTSGKSTSDVGRAIVRSAPTKIIHVGGAVAAGILANCGQIKVLSPIVAALPPIPRKPNENKYSTAGSLFSESSTISSNISHKPMMLKSSTSANLSPQSHREILINKQIMSSPKTKGFTELSSLLEQTVKEESSAHTVVAAASNKGFMPIALETSATNQLPAQISVQRHQSSSELEAEHDKQLDLINSIVQDELKKSNEAILPATNINENIPELVKMLESTENVLVENTNTSKKEDCNVSNINDSGMCGNANVYGNEVSRTNDSVITDIDINNASLLATPDGDDDLPDDILQLVDMMQDDKTLQEAVKVLGAGDCNDSISNVSSNSATNQKPPPLTLITQQHPAAKINILEDIPRPSKSIIQMSISNLPVASITPISSISSPRATLTKSTPLVRSEPIQIIRGNGRVITLPPIEAPTTRAKRRAQVQPNSIIQNAVATPVLSSGVPLNVNESSLDNSLHSNSSVTSASSIAQEKKVQDSIYRRRGSKESVSAGGSVGNKQSKGRSTASKKVRSKTQSEVDANESANEDDDDPNKLWCICRQPHNNRFMICCDACEDWFHGTCVNITKAMGLEMEQKGIDWTCPKCVKKQEEKKQPKITDLLVKKPIETVPQLSTRYYPLMPIVTTAPTATIQQNVPETILEGINIQHPNISKAQAKEITQTVIDTSKTRIQPGQFINLKDLSSGGKKVIIQAAGNSSSGQKKLFVTTQSIRTSSTPIRTIAVVKHIPGHGNQIHHHQSIKVIRTISPAKSPAQNFATTAVPGSASKTINSNDTSTLCIVCKKPARVNSIYCSDDCIRKHAQNALHSFMSKTHSEVDVSLVSNVPDDKAKKKPKGLFEDLLSMADRKPKVERVNVYERKSGRILTGSSAPTISNLKKWLQENPTFEVVQPGSLQALDIEKKQKLRTQHSSSPTGPPKAATSPPPLKLLPMTSPVQQKTDVIRSDSPQTAAPSTISKQTPTPQLKSNKSIVDFVKSSSPSTVSRPGTPKQLQKYPQNVFLKADKIIKPSEDVKSIKEKSNSSKKQANNETCSSKSTNSDGEPIRLLVRRTLKEQLVLRSQDEDSSVSTLNSADNVNMPDFPKLTPEEIEEFANATELEMYNYFNRDAGIKYKAKYRSLIFNIKDRKNHTLFAKICRKHIEPKQLVRMTPDEMASQELAQWREQENKHQLEMIKKSELDLLSCAKNYVLKTHKGEEVIESKSTEYENVDITIPVEDVVAALNKTDFAHESSSTTRSQSHWSDVDSTLLCHSNVSELHTQPVEDKMKTSKDKDKERDKEKDRHRDRDRNRDREKRHKSKDPYRDKSHSRKRSRSRSRSRSRERIEKRHKSSHKEEKRDREKDRIKERSERDQHSDVRSSEKKFEKKTAIVSKSREVSSTKRHQHHEQFTNPLETYNLIDQILESTKTVEEAANLVPDRDKDLDIVRKTSGTPLPSQIISSTTSKGSADTNIVIDIDASPHYVESDQEPTSTVSIPTPPHDPYARFMSLNSPIFDDTSRCNATTLWTGDINMVDVASFQLSVQPVLGNCVGLAKLLAKELDVVGRIGPETVWDYISKIKKSPNKEIVVIRLIPASESETSAYKILYEYLDNRNRLGVVKSVSPYIKDFYIYPLGAGKQMPIVLRHSEPVEFYDDPCRPDMLIGILIRVVGKRQNQVGQPPTVVNVNNSITVSSKFGSRVSEVDPSQSPPGSPKIKKRRQSIVPKDIDVDAIIKAPIVSKSLKGMPNTPSSVLALTDADEPYSPGGSSDDDLPLLPVKLPVNSNQMQTAEDELKRKMEEINRQIAAQEMEIAGLLTGETTKFGANSSKTSKVLANIAIPSNLSQILASIKPTMVAQDPPLAVPPPPPLIGSLIKPATSTTAMTVKEVYNPAETKSSTSTSSRLANLSEAELLSMVPDDIAIAPKPSPAARNEEPPPPGV